MDVNAKKIDQLFEILFQGDLPQGGGAEPLNRRFNWKDPVTKKAPPKIPRRALPGKKDFAAIDKEMAAGATTSHIEPGDLQGPEARDMTDRIGKHSMNDLLPPGEMATTDQLLDAYLKMKRERGDAAASAWLANYRRAEFEALKRRIVNALIG